MKILQGQRPDITPAQLFALLGAGVPIVASLLSAFGVYDLSPTQQDALSKAVQWAGLVAIALFGADFGIRAARNHADAKVKAQMLASPAESPAGPIAPDAPVAAAPATPAGFVLVDPVLPSDQEEFALAGPGDGLAMFTGFTVAQNGAADGSPDSRMTPVSPEDVI